MLTVRNFFYILDIIAFHTQLHWTNRNDKPPRLAQSRGAEEGSTSDLVIQDGQQFGPDVNKVPAHPRSLQYKGHASTCLHAHVPHPKATVSILQLSTPDCDRLEWPSQPDSCCFITWGFQSLRDEAPCLDPADMFLTHVSLSFSTAYSLLSFNLTHFSFSVLAPLPRRWAFISLLVSSLTIPHFPIFVLHISLLIALISSHTFCTIHHTSSTVSKLTFCHYHWNRNRNPSAALTARSCAGCAPDIISMGQCKKDVTPLLMHWSYILLVLTYQYVEVHMFLWYGLKTHLLPQLRWLCAAALAAYLTWHAEVYIFLLYDQRDSYCPAAYSCAGYVATITCRSPYFPLLCSKRLSYCPGCIGCAGYIPRITCRQKSTYSSYMV